MTFDYTLLPSGLRRGVQEYIEHGRLPGGFLTAVIQNNLSESFGSADENNRRRLFDIVQFFYNEAPSACWGSKEAMVAWVKRGGLHGPVSAVSS